MVTEYMFLESMNFDNQQDTRANIASVSMEDAAYTHGLDDSEYVSRAVNGLELAMHTYAARRMREVKVTCKVIGQKKDKGYTVNVYESYQDACIRTEREAMAESLLLG
jgi:hypothetical protein